MEFTKGEWKVDRKRSSFEYDVYSAENPMKTIARVDSGVSAYSLLVPTEGEANTRLIAQAPKMYEALKDVWDNKDWGNNIEIINKVKQVIAEGEGGTEGR